jgi:hypothetical protein
MEILYGSGIFAVVVLCLALLSTARRILRSSPMSNAQFGTTRMYEVTPAEQEMMDEISSARILAPTVEALHIETAAALYSPMVLERVEAVSAQAMEEEEEPLPAEMFYQAAEPIEPEQSWASRWMRIPKPTRQTYNYALECLLIGVSAWILIKTQRETLQLRSTLPALSRDRVA